MATSAADLNSLPIPNWTTRIGETSYRGIATQTDTNVFEQGSGDSKRTRVYVAGELLFETVGEWEIAELVAALRMHFPEAV